MLSYFSAFSQPEKYKIYSITKDEGLLSDYIECVLQDNYGFLWIANFEGLNRWDGHTFKKYRHSDNDSTSISHNIVYSIFQDSKKRLWFGTNGGLNLYDREKDCFIHCNIGGPSLNISINVIREDSKHQLWLGTPFGLCKYTIESGKQEWYSHDKFNANSLSDNEVMGLAVDKNDNLWIGTFNGGVNKFVPESTNFIHFLHEEDNPKTISSNKVRTLLVDHKGNIWIGTFESGVTLMNANGEVIRHYTEFLETKQPSARRNAVISLYEDKKNNIWVGSDNEPIYFMDKDGKKFVPFENSPYKKYNAVCHSVSSMFEDSFGNFWFATHGYGLFYTNSNKNIFRHYHKKDNTTSGLEHDIAACFFEDAKGNTWIGTDGGGLTFFDQSKNQFTTYTTKDGLSSNSILDIKEDKKGNLWLATWSGGLICFNPLNHKSIVYTNNPKDTNSLLFNNIKSIVVDDSLIWIGTHGEGIAVLNLRTNKFIHHKNNRLFSFDMRGPSWINHLFKDSKGRIWISCYDGLFMYDRKKLQRYVHLINNPESIVSNDVNMVTQDQKGRIWIITESGGLELYDEKVNGFIHYSDKYKLPHSLKAIIFDNKEKLWLSSNEGLMAFDPVTGKSEKYDVSDGLQGNFFFIKSVMKSRSGELYFGGTNGFNIFYPDSIKADVSASPIYFTDLTIFDELQKPDAQNSVLKKVIQFTDTLVLLYSQSFFSIEFAAVNLYSPEKIQYAYKLEGLRDQWINIQSDRKVSFTNLDPGTYVFKIRYTRADGQPKEADKKLVIVVLPPWWKTVWFKVLLVLFIFGVIVLVFYIRVNAIKKRNTQLKSEVANRTQELTEANSELLERNDKIKIQNTKLEEFNREITRQSERILKQQQEILTQNQELEKTVNELTKLNKTKDKFFSILAHDLKNHVQALTGISSLLKKNFPHLAKEAVTEYIESINQSSGAIYQLLVNLLDWARAQSKNLNYSPVPINVQDLIVKNFSLLEQQFKIKNIHFESKINSLHTLYADYPMVDTVIRNLLSNSIKFTPSGGKVSVESEEMESGMIIRVCDTGIGMTEEQIKNLFKIDKNHFSKGTEGETGTGLGLIISSEFIEINKGSMEIKSEPGKGSFFTILLPKNNSSVPPAIRKPAEDTVEMEFETELEHEKISEEKKSKVKGKRVLVVDDHKEIRAHLRLLLSGTFTVYEAENGDEGLKVAEQIQPDIIISDMVMPVMDGIQFCKAIKNKVSTCHIPVIILTGQTNEESQLSGYEAGAEVYLTKPVNQNILFQVILNFIQDQETIRNKILQSNGLFPEEVVMNKLDEEFLNKITVFIEEHYSDEKLDYKMICEHVGMSRTVLYSKFKTITGQGVHEYIKIIRLKKSLKLLFERRLSVSEIAYDSGFNSPSYFIRCFSKQYGMPPKEYLAAHKD